jgi:putative spermidine/putrescine transport system permease protein
VGRASKLLAIPYVVVVGLFLLAPTVIVIVLSFESASYLSFPPTGWSLHNYGEFLHGTTWTHGARTSLEVGLLATLLATSLGTLAALGLVRGRFIARGAIIALILSPAIVPTIVVALGVYVVDARLHLVGNLFSFVAAHAALGIPFVVVNVAASLRTVDRNLELAARNLGAGPVRTFMRITFPLILPGVLAGAVFAFVTSWDEVVIARFLSTPYRQTLPVVVWGGVTIGTDPTVAAAASMVTFVSLALLVAFTIFRWRRATVRSSGEVTL